jgi:superfamily II DNA or RNA helicase
MEKTITKEASFKLRDHQKEVLHNWEKNNYFGFVQHGTGSGKTITGLEAIRRWHEKDSKNYALIVVPTKILMEQWIDEINKHFSKNVLILKKGGGLDTKNWHSHLLTFKEGNFIKEFNIFLTTYSSLSGDFPRSSIESKNLLLVADEAHNLGTEKRKIILEMNIGSAIGLSATPERFEDSETQEIINFFDGVLQPIYGIKEGVRDGYLSKYDYFLKTVPLSYQEMDEWREFTKKIVGLAQRLESEKDKNVRKDIRYSLDRQRQERAKIKKKAESKVAFVKPILEKNYISSDRWLIYCSDTQQVNDIQKSISDLDIPIFQYLSSTDEDITANLNYFKSLGGIILCCKMLDEGVNIPSINKGIILASSQTSREFIQRRGRLLRVADKKDKAQIWDPIVIPPEGDRDDAGDNIVIQEIERATIFAETANNKSALHKIEAIALEYNIYFEDILNKISTDRKV